MRQRIMAGTTLPMAAAATRSLAAHWLVADFDGTCTAVDTTPVVPQLAARFSSEPENVLSRFRSLENKYFELLSELDTIEATGGYDASGLEASLRAMDDVSNAITEALSNSGILAGIRAAEVAPVLSEWKAEPSAAPVRVPELRDGCEATLASASAREWQLAILSLNWCPPLIHATLPIFEAPARPPLVWSNRIEETSGRIANEVNGAVAKRAVIERLVRDRVPVRPRSSEAEAEHAPRVVYIGDSATDLLAMLAADVGILIGESQSARDVARRHAEAGRAAARPGGAARAAGGARSEAARAVEQGSIELLLVNS